MPSLGEVVFTTTLTVTPDLNGTTRHALFQNGCGRNPVQRETGVLIVKRKYYTNYISAFLSVNVRHLDGDDMFYLQNNTHIITTAKRIMNAWNS